MFRHHMEPFDTISDYLLKKLKLFLKTLRFCPSLNPTKSRTLKKHDSTRSFERSRIFQRSRNVETLQTFVQVSDKTSDKYTQVFHTNGRAGF